MNATHIARSRMIGLALVTMLALVIGVLLPPPAHAGTATLVCTPPATRTDGAPITGTLTYRVYRGTSAAAVASSVAPIASGLTTCAYTDAAAPSGTVWYAMTAVEGTQESAKTPAQSVVIPVAPPGPPTGFTVQAVVAGVNVSPVYRILQDGSRSEQVAGFVDIGAVCSGGVVFTYRGRAYRRVDSAAVKWWSTRVTDRVAAPCA